MTLVSQIITDAYRQSNLLAIGASPTTAQQTEALRYVNRIVKSVLGNEAGARLEPFPIGRNNVDRPFGYPWYDDTPSNDWFVPKDKRLVLNLDRSLTLYLHPKPDDGTRVGVSDVSDNLATYNLVLDGNGRTIEDANTLTLSTNGLNAEWFYRSDLGNWMRVTNLQLGDEFPFPEDFDDMFITMLAMRLNPAYSVEMDQQSAAVFTRSRAQFRARYKGTVEVESEEGLIRMPRVATDRDGWTRDNYYGDPTSAFDRGLPW